MLLKAVKQKVQSSGKNVSLVFRQLDSNADNHLNFTELQHAFGLMNFDIGKEDMKVKTQNPKPQTPNPKPQTPTRLKVLMNYLDTNGDKYVNYKEFLDWIEDPNYAKDYDPFMGPRRSNLKHFNHVQTPNPKL